MARRLYLTPWGSDEWALRRPDDLQPYSLHRTRQEAEEAGHALARRGWEYLGPPPEEPPPPPRVQEPS